MGGIELAIHQQRAVEVQDRPLLVAGPFFQQLAGLLVVLADGLIVDGIEILVIDADALVGLGYLELADLLKGGLGERGGGDESQGSGEEADEQGGSPAVGRQHIVPKKSLRGLSNRPGSVRLGRVSHSNHPETKEIAMTQPKHIPAGMTPVTPHLVVAGAAEAIEFYKKAFGALEDCRIPGPDGKIIHAQVRIEGAAVMLCEEMPHCNAFSPKALKGSPVTIHLFVPDVDAFVARAVKAGATVGMPVQDMFWGDRYGQVVDPFGHSWSVATHVRDLTPEEMQKAMLEQCGAPA